MTQQQDQQNNASNQDWKHKKGYGSTVLLAVVVICGLVAVINKGNSHRTIVTSPVGNNLIRSKPDKGSSTYEDTCLRNDLTKEELATTVSFLQDEYMVPYLKTLTRKELMDSIVVVPASVPSGVQVLDPSDDSSPSIFNKPCGNLGVKFFNILSHVGTVCYQSEDNSVIVKGTFSAFGKDVYSYKEKITSDLSFPLTFIGIPIIGNFKITLEVAISKGYVRLCAVLTVFLNKDKKQCTDKVYW